ncbi:MAG: hypothetical protein E6J79_10520 [Deltaproteobacteria bacterium]|nr:MAG: hypothetical protein E6J79_10520 [Deltaproteobacteria bacterium]
MSRSSIAMAALLKPRSELPPHVPAFTYAHCAVPFLKTLMSSVKGQSTARPGPGEPEQTSLPLGGT